jgi:hypothetical protein
MMSLPDLTVKVNVYDSFYYFNFISLVEELAKILAEVSGS